MKKAILIKKPFAKKTLRILKYALPHWKLFALIFISSFILTAAALANPYLTKILLDDVLINKKFEMFFWVISAFLVFYVLSRILSSYYMYKSTELSQKMVYGVKQQLFDRIESLNIGFLQNKKIGDIMARMDDDVNSINTFISTILNSAVLNTLKGFGIVAVSLSLSVKATLLALAFFPLYFTAYNRYTKRSVEQYKRIRKKISAIFSFLQEDLSAIKDIKIFSRERIESKKFKKLNMQLIALQLKNTLINIRSGVITGIIVYLPSFIILSYGGYQVLLGALTVGSLMALTGYITQLFDPIIGLSELNRTLKTNMVSADRVFEFLDAKNPIIEKPNAKALKNIKGDIELKHVYFKYEKDKPILNDINLKISPGEKIGIVGPTGSGKSTLTSLLLRLYDPDYGKITMDGINIKEIKINSLRKHIGYVSQDPVLFNTTIKENIRFGNPKAKDEDIIRAAKLANIHHFIESLPRKYDAVIGERGLKLSGGEKQRIAIARVILKNPSVLILDEPTSSLDAETENKIKQSISYITKDKTALIIAHRLSTLENVDRIIVIKNSRIMEEGGFSELMAKRSEFYDLYKASRFEIKGKK